MRQNRRRMKTNLEQYQMQDRHNRFYYSPRNIGNSNYNPHSYNRSTNSNRTIYLQKSDPISFFPITIKLIKKDGYNSSFSPQSINYYSPSDSINNNNSYAYYPIKGFRKKYYLEKTPPNNRRYNNKYNKYIYNDNSRNNRNLSQINRLKNSLGNPNQARNVMIKNNVRNNRYISVSPSQNSYIDSRRDKINNYYGNNEIETDRNNYFDDKYRIKYFLPKNHVNKLRFINKKKFISKSPLLSNINNIHKNNLRFIDNTKYNNRSFSYRFYPNNDSYINKYNLENSPDVLSNYTDINQYQKGGRNNINNNFRRKRVSPITFTSVLNNKTPLIISRDKIIKEEINLNDFNDNINNYNNIPNNIFINNNIVYSYNVVKIKLDDLIFIERRLNDIIMALNNGRNIFEIGAINESVEFFVFYFHSSLKNKLSLFFLEPNRLVVKSAFNLNLFIVILTYHLSLNPTMINKVILLLRKIYELIKMNLFLLIRKIMIYYGYEFCRKNESYFRNCIYYLNQNGLSNTYEKDIIDLINMNCISIVNDVGNILNYYKTINNRYFDDFQNIYFNLSKMNEQDMNNYFYNNLFNLSRENFVNQQRMNYYYDYNIDDPEDSKFNDSNDYYYNDNINDINNFNNNYNQNQDYSFRQETDEDDQFLNNIILSYKRNKEFPPFLPNQSTKKYTLVLDLLNTLINMKVSSDGKKIIHLRPGLISFLTAIKPFYEIVSFSKLSKKYSNMIIQVIEGDRKLFDYNLYREHCSLVKRKFVKDITRIGRDIKKIIMIDDFPENLKAHIENGILILPYDGDDRKEDRVLYELKKLLILFFRMGNEDIRSSIKKYKSEIYNKITLGLIK